MEEKIINSICFLSVSAVTYSLLIILLHRLLWSYFQPWSYSEWSTLPCLNGQSCFRHKENPFSQWHNCHFTNNAASLCIQLSLLSLFTCPLPLRTYCMHEAYVMFFLSKCTQFFLTACWEHSKEATLIPPCKRGDKRHNKPHRGWGKSTTTRTYILHNGLSPLWTMVDISHLSILYRPGEVTED